MENNEIMNDRIVQVHTARSKARTAREQIAAVSCAPSESANLLTVERNASNRSFSHRFCKLFCEAIVFLFHNSMGYAIMLAVMYYNGWLFVAVILGMGIGYFIFGHISMKINMENVQARTTTVICSPACPEAGGKTSGKTIDVQVIRLLIISCFQCHLNFS